MKNPFALMMCCGLMASVISLSGCQLTQQSRPTAQPAPAAEPMKVDAPAPMPGTVEMYFPTGDRSTSAVMLQRRMPAEVIVGQDFEYNIIVTNISKMNLREVSVKDTLPANMTIVSSDPTAMGRAPELMWPIGDLAAGQARAIKVTARATQAGTLTSCATVSYNSLLCQTTQAVAPGLKVAIEMTPRALLCDTIAGKITISNPGSGAARNSKINVALPAGLMTADGKSTVTIDSGTLLPGASRDFPIALKAGKTGSYVASATATADGGLSDKSGNASTVVSQAALSLAIKCPGQILAGRNASFEITVTNTSETASDATVISSPLPAGSTFVSASDGGQSGPGGVSWNIGTLAPKATKTVRYEVKPTGMAALATTASARGTCVEPVNANCTTQIVGIPAMLLDGVDDPDPIEVGQTVTYTLRVTNQSTTSALTNIRLTATLSDPAKMTVVSSTGPTGAGTAAANKITFPAIATLAPRETREFKIVVRAADAGQVQVMAEAVSNEITRALVKTETTNFFK